MVAKYVAAAFLLTSSRDPIIVLDHVSGNSSKRGLNSDKWIVHYLAFMAIRLASVADVILVPYRSLKRE